MNLPFSEFKAGMDYEERFIHSLVIEVKHNKNTILGLENELSLFSKQIKELTDLTSRYIQTTFLEKITKLVN